MREVLEAKRDELRKRSKKGFTLMELLIVVAIIAILVAIAIPIFTSQLEKARAATTVANIRSAYSQAMIAYMTETSDTNNGVTYTSTTSTSSTTSGATVTVAGVDFESTSIGVLKSTASNLPAKLYSYINGGNFTSVSPGSYKLIFSFSAGSLTSFTISASSGS